MGEPRPSRSATLTWSLSFLAGGCAGATAKTIIAPLDRVKILFQISHEPFSLRAVAASLRATLRNEGFWALFRGNAAQVLRIYPYSGIQLACFDLFSRLIVAERRALRDWGEGSSGERKDGADVLMTPLDRVLAGSLAGAVSVVVTYPLDLMRARLAVQHATPNGALRYRGLAHAFLSMHTEHGWRSFYRGMAPTLLGILPYAGISFATYGTLKQMSRDRRRRDAAASAPSSSISEPPAAVRRTVDTEPSNWERLVFGGVAGLAGQASTYPLDIVRRRMQTEGFTPLHARAQAHSTRSPLTGLAAALRHTDGGIIDTLQFIYLNEGRRGLFKGLSMNVIKGPIAVGVSFTTYDILQSFLARA